MVLTVKLAADLKSYLQTNLNTRIQEVGMAIGVTLKEIKLFQTGWIDPFKLMQYNGLLIIPDRLAVSSSDRTLIIPFDLVVAISGKDEEDVALQQLANFDALYDLVESDKELGGLCFEASVLEHDYFAPAGGTGPVAINHTKINLVIDTLLA